MGWDVTRLGNQLSRPRVRGGHGSQVPKVMPSPGHRGELLPGLWPWPDVRPPWAGEGEGRGLWARRGGPSAVCLPTATGSLHKAVVSGDSRAHLVEEIQLFAAPEPVRNLQLAPTQVGGGLPKGQAWGAGPLPGVAGAP